MIQLACLVFNTHWLLLSLLMPCSQFSMQSFGLSGQVCPCLLANGFIVSAETDSRNSTHDDNTKNSNTASDCRNKYFFSKYSKAKREKKGETRELKSSRCHRWITRRDVSSDTNEFRLAGGTLSKNPLITWRNTLVARFDKRGRVALTREVKSHGCPRVTGSLAARTPCLH